MQPKKHVDGGRISLYGDRVITKAVDQAIAGTGLSRSEAFFEGVKLWLNQQQTVQAVNGAIELSETRQ